MAYAACTGLACMRLAALEEAYQASCAEKREISREHRENNTKTTDLRRVSIWRIIDITAVLLLSSLGRGVFFVGWRRHGGRDRWLHVRAMLRRRVLGWWEHLHVTLAVVRPNSG